MVVGTGVLISPYPDQEGNELVFAPEWHFLRRLALQENNLMIARVSMLLKCMIQYRGADKSLTRPGRKQALKHDRDARDFKNIETRAVIKFLFLQGKAPKEIHTILTETLSSFLPGRAKDLSAPLYYIIHFNNIETRAVIKLFSCKARRRKKFTTF